MVQSVLGSLILGYRPLWNRARKLAAIQLYVHSEASALVDTAHLLRTLQELWSASSPPILLSPQSHQLLSNMLEHAPRGAPWIEVRGNWLSDSTIYALVKAAHQRGLKLVWRGELASPVLWALWCVFTSVVALSQPAVGQAFPAALAGRALSAFNLVIFAGVFSLQWGIGLAIDGLRAQGLTTLVAHQCAFAGFAAAKT